MNILFFLEPWIELNTPNFRSWTFARYIQFVKGLRKSSGLENNIKIVVGEHTINIGQKANIDTSEIDIYGIEEKKLKKIFPNYLTAQSAWYNEIYEKKQLTAMQELIVEKIGEDFIPDVIIVWESPCIFLQKLYPDALIISQMPGIFNRIPFSDTVTMDFGLFKDSFIGKYGKELKKISLKTSEEVLLETFKKTYTKILTDCNPWTLKLEQERKRFKKLILLPLQVTNYFHFRESCKFNTQFEYLTYVLDNIDPNIGVIVTQYNAGDIKDPAVTKSNIEFLRQEYPNFIFLEEFDKFDSSSQFLLSSVDAVITITSAVGLQAMLWNKPFFTINSPYLGGLSEGNSIEEMNKFLLEDKEHKNLDGALFHILAKTQVPSENLFNGEWFYNFLQHYVAKAKTKPVNFDFYDNVNSNLEEHFEILSKPRTHLMLKQAKNKGFDLAKIHNIKYPSGLIEKIRNPKYKVISFDIFDTLICRPFTKPSDIFRFIDPEVKKVLKVTYFDFLNIRMECESEARKIHKEKFGYEDINFNEIYEAFQEKTGATKKQIEAIKKLEKDTEMRFVRRRESICKALDEAIALGRRVILVSDMYLEEDYLRKLLTKNAITGYEKLYVSSNIRLKKHSGAIYPYILNDLNVKASEMLHIGDSEYGDIKQSREKGIDQYHTPRAVDLMFKNNVVNAQVWPNHILDNLDISNSIYLGLVANKIFDNPDFISKFSLFEGRAYTLGFYGAGALLFSFVQWLIEESIKDKIGTLYFVSRDGMIMKKVYDIISPFYKNAPKSEYLYCSRMCFNSALLTNVSEIQESLFNGFFSVGTLYDLLFYKYGIDPNIIDPNLLNKFGFTNIHDRVSVATDKVKLRIFLEEVADIIIKNSLKQKNIIMEYLKDKGITNKKEKSAIVDIGYLCSMQKALINFTNIDIGGYYLQTRSGAKTLARTGVLVKSYAGECVNEKIFSVLGRVPLLEVLFSNHEGSLLKFVKTDNKIIPILLSVENEKKRIEITEQAQAGIMDFICEITTIFTEDIKSLYLHHSTALNVFNHFSSKPSPRDATIFQSAIFEDRFNGNKDKFIVPPYENNKLSEELLSNVIWRQGTRVLFEHHQKQLLEIKSKPHNFEPAVKKVNKKNSLRKKIAGFLIKKYVSEKKYRKFLKDPYAFFNDSKNKTAKKLSRFFK